LTANLFSELLVEVIPKLRKSLKRDGCMILSGVLQKQETELARALSFSGIRIVKVRRRGKWIALLAAKGGVNAEKAS
jgi:ribosomal protein L11 methyltransferase